MTAMNGASSSTVGGHAAHLFRDGLHCVLHLLPLRDARDFACVCTAWAAAARSAPSRHLELQLSRARFRTLLNSRTRHHARGLVLPPTCAVGLRDLTRIATALPLLQRLDVAPLASTNDLAALEPGLDGSPSLQLQFGSRLIQLRLDACMASDGNGPTHALHQALINALPTAVALQSLDFSIMHESAASSLLLAPLLDLPQLTSLTMLLPRLRPGQIAVISRISTLSTLSVNRGFWTHDGLVALAQSHTLVELRELDLSSTSLQSASLAALATFPSLAVFKPQPFKVHPFEWIMGLQSMQLETLALEFDTAVRDLRSEHVLPLLLSSGRNGTGFLSHVASLSFRNVPLLALEMNEILCSSPRLMSLALHSQPCAGLVSTLNSAISRDATCTRLSAQLTSLHLRQCTGITHDQLLDLDLPVLASLHVALPVVPSTSGILRSVLTKHFPRVTDLQIANL